MKTILVPHHDLKLFLQKWRRLLNKGPLGSAIGVEIEGDDIIVVFRKMGESRIYFRWEALPNPANTGPYFRAERYRDEIGMGHGFFRDLVTGELRTILERLGATVI